MCPSSVVVTGDFGFGLLVTEMGSSYNAATPYVNGAAFLSADHVGDLYQDLVFATPGPSNRPTAGLVALGLLEYGMRGSPRLCCTPPRPLRPLVLRRPPAI